MAKNPGVCTPEMTEYLKWRALPPLKQYIHSQFRCEQAYKHIAEAEQSQFENKDALKKASAIFFEVLRAEPCIQGYVGLAYLFLLLDQAENAIKYLAAAQEINPHDIDVTKLLEFIMKEKPDLKRYIHPPSFKDDDEDLINYQDDIPSLDNINHLDDLPSELLVLIFSWLKATSVAKFRQVSKHYRDLLVNNVYWQEQCAMRWSSINNEDFKKLFKEISTEQFYYNYYQRNHHVHINWLNRTTKFEEIKSFKGESVGLYSYPNQQIFTVHLDQPNGSQKKRSIEFFRFKRGKIHHIKRLHAEIDSTNRTDLTSWSVSTADHMITYANNGTLVVSDINKRESKIHQIEGKIDVISGLPGSNGMKFLAGSANSVWYMDGPNKTKTVEVCEPNAAITSMAAQHDGKTAILTMESVLNRTVKIFDLETSSVVDTFSTGPHLRIQWADSMPDVLVALDRHVFFYDIRSKNKFVVPRTTPSSISHSVAMDDTKLFVLETSALTLFDCRYSSSIVDSVPLPQQHAAVPGLGLWGLQKLVYSSKQHLIEWDLGQIIKPVKL